MSIRIMSLVWEASPQSGGNLLVLLALADFANDFGECWPAVATLARKARMTERHVRRILADLEKSGELERLPGEGQNGTNRFRLNAPPDKMSPGRGGPSPLTPASVSPDAGVIRSVMNHQEPSPDEADRKKEAEAFANWFKAELEATGVKNLRVTPGVIAGWVDAYDKLLRIDKRTKAEIVRVCKWARRDPFWSSNFLSPVKLRQKNRDGVFYYDVLLHRLTHETDQGRSPSRALRDNSNLAALEELDRKDREAVP